MLESAPKEEEIKQEAEGVYTESAIEEAVWEGLQLMQDRVHDPVAHKLAVLKVCNNMVAWHSKVGETAHERGETECGNAWLRDAGKWQAVMDIVMSISLGDNDCWTIGHDCD